MVDPETFLPHMDPEAPPLPHMPSSRNWEQRRPIFGS